jgi:hypothetical protein
VRWPDLDSHLNLVDDPFAGPPLEADRLHPGVSPGLGVALTTEFAGSATARADRSGSEGTGPLPGA